MKRKKIYISLIILVALVLLGAIYLYNKSSHCPEVVNCMPGPGSSKCEVPFGCAGITKIVE
jgi:hypothetical protein